MGTIHQRRVGAHVVLLEFDNPPANALGRQMRAMFRDVLSVLDNDTSVRALILMGRGRGFCGGDDLKEQEEASKLPPAERAAQLGDFADVVDRVEAFRVPVIAAVNGWCMGGGLELALCCDIRIASAQARFACSGVNVGLMAFCSITDAAADRCGARQAHAANRCTLRRCRRREIRARDNSSQSRRSRTRGH